ncbi:MAG: hypothetical protein HOH74_17085 [Gemmatimonadetes bacterium]|jgi:hypothetical protein|nr:hypothetical protein [Gemmatimonadota bacterium]MBT6147153.1 hypothetical protein [Gemmatimonadota bacterium]
MRLLFVIALFLSSAWPVTASTVTRTVRSTGQAAIIDGDTAAAAEAARHAALREAVESGVGVLISSTTRASNYAIIEDEIFSATRGYVRSYEILTQGKSPDGGVYEVSVDAQVDLHRLEKRLASIDLAHAIAGRPRYLCRGSLESESGDAQWSAALTQDLRLALAPLGERLDPAVAGDGSLALSDRQLATTYLADVLVDARARFETLDPVVPGGQRHLSQLGVVSRVASITLEVRWLDEASSLNRWSATGRGAATSPSAAQRKALSQAIDQEADSLRAILVEDLRRRAFGDRVIHLAIQGKGEDLDEVEESWSTTAWTRGVLRSRGRDNGQGRYDVTVAGSAYELARQLSAGGLASLDVEVMQVSANRIRLRVSAPPVTAAQR